MTRDDPPPSRSRTPRRWLVTFVVLGVAVAAGFGNAPGPRVSLVRHQTAGRFPPSLKASNLHVNVALPTNRRWVALYFWRYAEPTPLLQIRARSLAHPLPVTVTLSFSVGGVDKALYEIIRAPGDTGKSLVDGTPAGWYAVLLEDDSGQRSMVTFEAGKKVSNGYFSCSAKPRLLRHETAAKLAPPDVRRHFEGSFKAIPRLRLPGAPGPTPPAKKTTPAPTGK